MVTTLKSPFFTSLYFGKQTNISTLATSYQKIDVEDIGEMGGDIKKATFTPLSDDRSDRAGSITLTAAKAGGFKLPMKQNNLTGIGFASALFANINQPASTKPLYGLSSSNPITAMTTTVLTASGGGLSSKFKVRDIVQLDGWTNTALNVLNRISAVDGTTMTLSTALPTTETISGTGRYVDKVGHRYASGLLSISVSGSLVSITSSDTSSDGVFTGLGLEKGQAVFVGGDDTATKFTNNGVGIGWVSEVTDDTITFDRVTWSSPQNETGTGKTIELYWGSGIRNRSGEVNIIPWEWTIGAKLGLDNDGYMVHLVKGAILDEMKLTLPKPDDNSMVSAELNFVPIDYLTYAGSSAGSAPSSNILAGTNEVTDKLYTTSDDLVFAKVYKRGNGSTPTNEFAYISDMELNIKNNLEPQAFLTNSSYSDVVAKNLEITGKFTSAYTTDGIAKLADIKADTKYGLVLFWARNYDGKNSGIMINIPFIEVKTTGTKVSRGDAVITYDVDFRAVWDDAKFQTMHVDVLKSLPAWAVSSSTTYI